MHELTFYSNDVLEHPERLGKWEVALLMGERARREVRGYPAGYYFEAMAGVRAKRSNNFASMMTSDCGERANGNAALSRIIIGCGITFLRTKWGIEARSIG